MHVRKRKKKLKPMLKLLLRPPVPKLLHLLRNALLIKTKMQNVQLIRLQLKSVLKMLQLKKKQGVLH